MKAEKVVDLYGQYDGRWLNTWNKQSPQLRRWLEFLDVLDTEIISMSDDKECTFAVTADLHPIVVVVDAEAAGEWVEGRQGLGHSLLEPGHVEEISSSDIVGAVQVDRWGVAFVGLHEV